MYGNDGTNVYESGLVQTYNNADVNANYMLWVSAANITFSNLKIYPVVVDLTLLYGSAIDGMTDAQILAKFESEFPGYHDYSAGKLISNDAESIETVGFNQWDEEWEVGGIVGGSPVNNPSHYRSKNFCACTANTWYYSKTPSQIFIFWYDANKQYLSYSEIDGSTTITASPANAAFFKLNNRTTNTYNHDICLNLSDPAKNGTYEPYWKRTINLGLNSFKVKDGNGNVTTITGGLKSAGSVRDEIVGNKYIKRVGSVDMGTLSYSTGYGGFYTNSLMSLANFTNASAIQRILSARYEWKTYSQGFGSDSNCIFSASDGNIIIIDSGYSSVQDFKSAMSGVMLYYELATPIEYELADAIPCITQYSEYGTQRIISPQSSTPSAPFYGEWQYGIQQGDFISGLENSEFMIGSSTYIISEEEFNEIFGNL